MILLTGGTGFLGRFIVDELLSQGEKVRLLARNPSKVQAREGVDIIEGDVLDVVSLERAFEGVDRVIHSAALVSFWSRRREEMFKINVEGTANMVNLSLEAGIRKFVQISSVAALGRTRTTRHVDEKSKWVKSKLNTKYGRSKYLAELEVVRGVEEGLDAVICNPGIIVGPGPGHWDSGSPKIFSTIYKGLKFYNPGITGFVPVEDVARAVSLLLKGEYVNGERFILVSDSIPYKHFFEWVAKSVGVKGPSIAPPAFVVKMAAGFSVFKANLGGGEPLITPETARMSRFEFEYDGQKITKAFDFSYSDLKKAVEATGKQFLIDHGSHR